MTVRNLARPRPGRHALRTRSRVPIWVRRLVALPRLLRTWLALSRMPTTENRQEDAPDDTPTVVLEPVVDPPTDQHWRLDELVRSVADTQPIPAARDEARRAAHVALHRPARPSIELLEQVLDGLRRM